VLGLMWLWGAGLMRRRFGRLAAAAAGVAVAVALLASLGSFLAASKATMTRRSVASVPVDWQVEVQPGSDPAMVLRAARGFQPTGANRGTGAQVALPVGFAATSGLRATVGGTTQTTGPGMVLGLPDGYAQAFEGELRGLVGASTGVLLAQQTAANLHAGPGDLVTVGRVGLPPVTVRVAGVTDLPQADSLFQKIGAPAGAQPQAPPDNVLLLPARQWHQVFGPLAGTRPDLVRTQVHMRLERRLPSDPAAAWTDVEGAARNLETRLAGAGLVGDNLGAVLGAAREDALYAQVLFLFLGLPGAVLAALLTAAVAASGRQRRRNEQALLRTRGLTTAALARLAVVEAAMVGLLGAAAGLAGALAVGRLAFGAGTFGATPLAAAVWATATAAAVAGLMIAMATVALPARRDARQLTVSAARAGVGRPVRPRWMRSGLDLWLLATSGIVFWLTSRGGYNLVLVPEGVPTLSVSYWAFAGPALLWAGAGLLAWRVADLALNHGRAALGRAARPFAGPLAGTVAASLVRQRRLLARSLVLVALTASFAISTAVFNATYRQQADVDARLTNGADVTVTEPPGLVVGPQAAGGLAAIHGRRVEPMQHRFAYVGSDLQDLYGVRPGSVVAATRLQDAYFAGGTARQLIGRLASQPDAILVSAETVHDFQLQPGDPLLLRLTDSATSRPRAVRFHYAGVVKEFPTAPRDSFLVANADYVAKATGNPAVGTFLIDTGSASPRAVADRIRARLGTTATVNDLTSTRHVVASSLTAVDLGGLTRLELGFALLLAAASTGLVLALGLGERRRTFAIARALGARPRQLGAFVWAEAAFVTAGGVVAGVLAGWALSEMLVKVLSGVFDPPPAQLAVPWVYLATITVVAVVAVAGSAVLVVRAAGGASVAIIRELG
jgi:putative ABC transport system permease protein